MGVGGGGAAEKKCANYSDLTISDVINPARDLCQTQAINCKMNRTNVSVRIIPFTLAQVIQHS